MPTEVKINSINARTGESLAPIALATGADEVERLAHAAAGAAPWFAALARSERARLLDQLAAGLEARREDIVAIADTETALGTTRLNGELTRACFQLRFMADVALEGSYLGASVEHSGDTDMGPRPDLRMTAVPLGPIAVFGASNFPLAFSVPGGDTASALAAGCPVIVKAHPSHVGTSVMVADIFSSALTSFGAPTGVFAIVHGHEAGVALVQNPHIRAVGFTGSLAGGRALFDLAGHRAEPIPFYGELGSVNPLVVSEAAAEQRAGDLGAGIAGSMTLGAGQFCTKPGLFLVPDTEAGQQVVDALVAAVSAIDPGYLLNDGIRTTFDAGMRDVAAAAHVLQHNNSDGRRTGAVVAEMSIDALTDAPQTLLTEHFGPFGLVVRYRALADIAAVLSALPPALTGTVHIADDDVDGEFLTHEMRKRSGRIVYNGYPTGVAVAWGMQHGGQYPASTVPGATSVGAASVTRWTRPVSYQNAPQELLPDELTDSPTVKVVRRIDGILETVAS
ncbi:MAG: aldehyde dehydrogenase (NADP(+)) [Rhodococcus sp. (in: high G+C Gram-positive bacteria)]